MLKYKIYKTVMHKVRQSDKTTPMGKPNGTFVDKILSEAV